jgi:exosortase
MIDAGIHSQLLSAVGLILAIPGLSFLLLGTERTRLILFPLIMLLLTLPIPLAFTESLHMVLRIIATEASAILLPILGVPVFAQGTTLDIPNGTLQVADACSGFSTLYASITVGCMVAYFCPDWRRKVIVLLIAAPLAIAVNIVRVIMLTLLVQWFGLDVLKTSAHEISGLLTFTVALPFIFWIGNVRPSAEEGGV